MLVPKSKEDELKKLIDKFEGNQKQTAIDEY
jgi:hypothetical protein